MVGINRRAALTKAKRGGWRERKAEGDGGWREGTGRGATRIWHSCLQCALAVWRSSRHTHAYTQHWYMLF